MNNYFFSVKQGHEIDQCFDGYITCVAFTLYPTVIFMANELTIHYTVGLIAQCFIFTHLTALRFEFCVWPGGWFLRSRKFQRLHWFFSSLNYVIWQKKVVGTYMNFRLYIYRKKTAKNWKLIQINVIHHLIKTSFVYLNSNRIYRGPFYYQITK